MPHRDFRDHYLPDHDEYLRANRQRIIVIAPTRAACETIERALHTHVETTLSREHGDDLERLASSGSGFGIVAGTGTGKTLAIRPIAESIIGRELKVGVVNREREATPETPSWNVVIVTTGIARRWFQDNLIRRTDTLVVDEIHQTSAELELCLALGKRVGCRFIWLSATVDPEFYGEYLESAEILHTSAFDPSKAASVKTVQKYPLEFLGSKFLRKVIAEERGVAVFLPTRAEVEAVAAEIGDSWSGLTTAFYHGGEPIRVIRPFLDGSAGRPYLLAMTAAGQSALNIAGLDTVVIVDSRFTIRIDRGRNVLTLANLGANEILQMAGRVHGRVSGGEVYILSNRGIDFDRLKPQPPDFQLAGDSERVALTAAALGVDLSDLELPVPLDTRSYRRALRNLTERGIVEDGRLTSYGRDVEAMPVDRPWAELLINASSDLVPFIAVTSNVDSLHRMTRDGSDLTGLIVPGSDHLTVYEIYREAFERFGYVGEVFGLPRHLFDEGIDEWGEQRGVLVKAIEDIALGMASVYRTLEMRVPERLPGMSGTVRRAFTELIASIMPFDLVIDERMANGQAATVSRSSVCSAGHPVAGTIRYFADRHGNPRAAVEGTNITRRLVERFASRGDRVFRIKGRRKGPVLVMAQPVLYHGFEVDEAEEAIPEPFPEEHRDEIAIAFARAMLSGRLEHPSTRDIAEVGRHVDELWKRSAGTKTALSPDNVARHLADQLGPMAKWSDLWDSRPQLDVADFIERDQQLELEQLPDSIELRGLNAPLEYGIDNGRGIVRLVLRADQIRTLRKRDLPKLDRRLVFRHYGHRGDPVDAQNLGEMRGLLEREESRRRRQEEYKGRRGRGPGGGRRGRRGKGRGPGHRRR